MLAQAYNRQFNIQETRRHLDQAERLFLALQRPRGLAMVYQTTASLELNLGNYAAGKRYYQQALEIAERLNNQRGQAEELINLAYTAALQQDYASQKACALRALNLTRQIGNRFLEAYALNNLGEARRELGELPAAIKDLSAAREIGMELDILAEVYAILIELAFCYLAAGDLPAASQAADEMEAIYPRAEAGAQDSQRLLWAMARVRRAAGREADAADLLKRAYQLVEEKSAAIPDPASRQTFRELIFNRRIVAAYERGEWPVP